MTKQVKWIISLMMILNGGAAFATMDNAQMSVWVNEAIVATYTYDYKNVIPRQKEMALYYTAPGWIAFTTALNESKLLDSVNKNKYTVSAVATLPPAVKKTGNAKWEAVMPVMVMYKNSQNKQIQSLDVTLDFIEVSGQGVRGLAITSLQAKKSSPPCVCSQDASQ